jgi:hypothetical protein
MALRARPSPAAYVATFAFAGLAWSAAFALWGRGQHGFAVSALLVGVSLGPCLAGYIGAPRPHKPLQRRLALLSGGTSVLAPLLSAATRFDLDGGLAVVLVGALGAAVGHTVARRGGRARARTAAARGR